MLRFVIPVLLGAAMLSSAVTSQASAAVAFDTTLAPVAQDSSLMQPVWWHHYGWHHWGGWHRHHFCYWHPRACGW